MTSFVFLALFSGAVAGAIHTLTGPDHIAAIVPFFNKNQVKTWMIGLLWGIGHSSGVWVLGLLVFLFRELIPLEWLSHWSERLVGVLLVVLGLWSGQKAFRSRLHRHPHNHGGEAHEHFHFHPAGKTTPHMATRHRHSHAPLGIGLIHGLAGSSHFFGILPGLAFGTRAESLAFIGGFGFGAILAMVAFSWLLGVFVLKMQDWSAAIFRGIQFGFSALAIMVGVYWLTGSVG